MCTFLTSARKSVLALLCFQLVSHFGFANVRPTMCLVPRPHALFEHLIVQKCSRDFQGWCGFDCFCVFDLRLCFTPRPRALFASCPPDIPRQPSKSTTLASLPSGPARAQMCCETYCFTTSNISLKRIFSLLIFSLLICSLLICWSSPWWASMICP